MEDVRGDFGRIWRATYTQSNADEDIVIVTMPQSLLGQLKTALQKNLIVITVIFAAVFGLAFWVLAWLALMPYLIGQEHDPKHRLRWYHSLIYPAINLAVILIAGMVLLFPVPFFGIYFLLIIGLLLILGPISILIFVFVHARHLRISRGRAFASFLSVTLASNCCYLVFSLVIASLAGII